MSMSMALAAPGLGFESQVIAAAASSGFDVRRRCVDAADLLGACLGAPGLIAVLTASLPRLSPEVTTRLRASGSPVFGIAMSDADAAALALLDLDGVIECPRSAQELLDGLAARIFDDAPLPGVWNLSAADVPPLVESQSGRLIAVWGPAGAPGRTTTAMMLAQGLSMRERTAIIDADTAAPSVALKLGLADDVSGVILACRHAEAGSLSSRTLASSMCAVSERYLALTGLAHPRRWGELRPAALIRVFDQVKADFPYSVVDIGAAFTPGDVLTASPTAAADAALQAADSLVVVVHADPLGVARFLNALPELAECGVPMAGALTGGTSREQALTLIQESARRAGLTLPMVDLGVDPRLLDSALREGRLPGTRRRWQSRSHSTSRLLDLVA
ncbi:MAG: hypothetical protein ACR2JS_02615 [Candidatus Nanopelagicales bacterium]